MQSVPADSLPGFEDVLLAAARIAPHAHRTPVMTCASLDRMAGATLFFKCENLQKVGAFKFRGATNAVFSLPADQVQRGVATHSSGNHAAALALAASLRGVSAHIVMPSNAPDVKQRAVAEYGARIVLCQPTLQAREQALDRVVRETGGVFIHPYDDARVIAGQGTAALELLREVPDLDVVMTPVGGGGLLAGTVLATRGLAPRARVLAAEPAQADDAFRSLREGRIVPSVHPSTVADGLLTSLGVLNFAIIREGVDAIVRVDDAATIDAMRHMWERAKLLVEPSSAVPLAALLSGAVCLKGLRVGIILSGGNVDLDRLPWQQSKASLHLPAAEARD